MTKIWVIYTLMFGYGVPTLDKAHFDNESGCELYLHTQYTDPVIEAFQLRCVNDSPTMCQGKVCE